MSSLFDKIIAIELDRRKEKLMKGLDQLRALISEEIDPHQLDLIQEDIEFFRTKGRFWVHNTFAGGIIFLREPEVIEGITIEYNSETNTARVEVEYGSSERNARNVKYKPDAGKFESTEWKMVGIFPHFSAYEKAIQTAMMLFIGNFVRTICEDINQNSWFMRYENDFDLEVYLDNALIVQLPITAIAMGSH